MVEVDEYNSGIVLRSDEAEASVDPLDEESGTIVSTKIETPLVNAVN